jgi:beta-lactamase regulating signal transducer with metallopeptidase domain
MGTARALARAIGAPSTRFLRSEAISMPIACGVLRPTVVLPAEADTWPEDRVRVVLLHELAHVRRRDCLTQTVADAVCAVFWFNPLAWMAVRELRRERERACDDMVLSAGMPGPDYAAHLLEIARAMRRASLDSVFSSGVAMAHRSELEGRLMAILDEARPRRALSTRGLALATVFSLTLVVPLAAMNPWVQEENNDGNTADQAVTTRHPDDVPAMRAQVKTNSKHVDTDVDTEVATAVATSVSNAVSHSVATSVTTGVAR